MKAAPIALALWAGLAALHCDGGTPHAQSASGIVDTALVLAVDVSGSIDAESYRLQMQGIADAFADTDVQRTILSGRHSAMLVALVTWSDTPRISVPWTLISSAADADAFADSIRRVPRRTADFTCMSRMMQLVNDKLLPLAPRPAERAIVDISGDGRDNCHMEPSVESLRDELVAAGVTINGLPIRSGREANSIERWYEDHVIGGATAFVLPADGFADFGRAIRQKFVLEISRQNRSPSIISARRMADPWAAAALLIGVRHSSHSAESR
jgi:hypothetical protein